MSAISFVQVAQAIRRDAGARDDLSLDVREGEMFGLIGPTVPARRRRSG